jgi:integrase
MPKKVKLTTRSIEAIKPTDKPIIVYDTLAPGMGIRMMPTGHKAFVFVGRFPPSKNPTRRSLGAYDSTIGIEPELSEDELLALHVLSLAQARAKAQVWRRLIQRGIDPDAAIKRRRAEHEASERKLAADTFEVTARRFLAEHMSSRRTARVVGQLFENKFIAVWGSRPIASITKHDIIERIADIKRTSGNEAARQALAYIKLMFAWAMELDIVTASPCPTIKAGSNRSKLLAPKRARQRVLSDDEIRLIWKATEGDVLKTYPGASLVRLLLTLGCRRSELSAARWREFHLHKPGSETWKLPGERTKTGDPRIVPLPTMALQMIGKLPRFATGDFLFSALQGRRPFTAFSKMKERLDAKITKLNDGVELEQWGLHDLRRTMRTRLSALPIEPIVRELMIGHRQQGISPVYDVYEYEGEQRDGFEAWCSKLRDIVEPSKAGTMKTDALEKLWEERPRAGP